MHIIELLAAEYVTNLYDSNPILYYRTTIQKCKYEKPYFSSNFSIVRFTTQSQAAVNRLAACLISTIMRLA